MLVNVINVRTGRPGVARGLGRLQIQRGFDILLYTRNLEMDILEVREVQFYKSATAVAVPITVLRLFNVYNQTHLMSLVLLFGFIATQVIRV